MNKLLTIIALTALLAATAQAQTNKDNGAGSLASNLLTNQTPMDQILAVLAATNFAIEPYFTYADKAPTKVGGGVLALYNVNHNVGLGLGLDWLGNFSLVSANVTLQAPFHPLPVAWPTFTVSPFVLGGIATAYSGAGSFNGGASTVQDVGAYVRFGKWMGGQFNAGACWGQWTGVGPYDVKREHVFIGWSRGF